MRCCFTFLILLLVTSQSLFTQAKWELVLPPSPTSNQLVSLDFIDETTGWAVGEYGTILKTTDAGETWRIIEIPQLNYLRDVYFPTESTGYIVGEDGLILKSIDSGETWFEQSIRFTNDLHRVRFRDEKTGWIVGEKGLILYTTDGGENWDQQNSHFKAALNGLALIGQKGVCAVGKDSSILVTEDDGQIWQKRRFVLKDSRYSIFNFNDVFFLDEAQGWIGGDSNIDGILLKTTSGGEAWSEVKIDHVEITDLIPRTSTWEGFAAGIQQIYFLDWRYGFLLTAPLRSDSYGLYNLPFYTRYSGRKWVTTIQGFTEASAQPGRIAYLSDKRIINTGFGGEFRISKDKGMTWEYPNHHQRNFYSFTTGNNGALVAMKRISRNGYQFATSKDYGKSWEAFDPVFFDKKNNQQSTERFGGYYFIDDKNTLRMMAYFGEVNSIDYQIYESRDLGKNWHWVADWNRDNENFVSYFLAADTLIDYRIYKNRQPTGDTKYELHFTRSFDGGVTTVTERFNDIWYINRSTSPFVSKHYFFNGHTGFLIGSEVNIIQTTDTGRTWRNVLSGVADDLWDITFVNRQVGFISGDFGRILKTEDGGKTWRKTDSGTQEDIFAIGFRNELEGYAGTETGLLATYNGGETWSRIPLRYFHGKIWNIDVDEEGTCYAYTHHVSSEEFRTERPGGYMFLMVLKEGGVQVASGSEILPYSFTLYPNYPNPFNSHTIFCFLLPKTETVTLTLYNIRGQRVCTLLDKSLGSGEHEINWYAVNQAGQAVASGIYLARLQRAGEVKTRKVVVLR